MTKNILIIDYESEDYPQEMFKGYRVYNVSTMMDAVKRILLQRPHVIVANIDIYENDASILTHILKVNKNTPIVAITSDKKNVKIVRKNLPKQVYALFCKPVSMLNLVNAVNSAPQSIVTKDEHKSNQAVGKKIDNYVVKKTLGCGASGTVYKASDGTTEVAIKILKAQFNNDMKRFNRETKYLMAVDHPNIVKAMYARQLDDEYYYIVMELFEAEHLSRHLARQGFFSLEESTFLIREIAKGMAAAHKVQLIHRDLKPSNVLYNRHEKKIKIIDFGIAKRPEDFSLTTEGIALGTPAYMSPEQIITPEIDHRSDIYSLGIIFYNLLMGDPPFDGEDDHEVMRAQMYEEVSWPVAEKQVPQYIRDVIEKMLHKNREHRYQTMEEVDEALANVTSN
ncbi:serine/threonine protein kinase [Candidatus Uabimicrobium amorphum]|uniref:Serine/threonine protein kinase n=1 Tax=Uabimicrobium amorphum TaxID=2596890 RepID=A0A5S9IJ21_UABAM|nr:serine/threonine-protein kinase [Candidatus Uabimicrobium amorphum]BBM82457.1 serine/threonine protein kinase [Candidatus Uabimicrobium amorphum]